MLEIAPSSTACKDAEAWHQNPAAVELNELTSICKIMISRMIKRCQKEGHKMQADISSTFRRNVFFFARL